MSPLAHGVVGPDLPVAIVDLAAVRTRHEQEPGGGDSAERDHAVVRVPSQAERDRHAEILRSVVEQSCTSSSTWPMPVAPVLNPEPTLFERNGCAAIVGPWQNHLERGTISDFPTEAGHVVPRPFAQQDTKRALPGDRRPHGLPAVG